MIENITNVVDAEACSSPAYEALSQLTPDQLAATQQMMLWLRNTDPTVRQMQIKMVRVFGGDSQAAALVAAALRAAHSPRLQAANDALLPR